MQIGPPKIVNAAFAGRQSQLLQVSANWRTIFSLARSCKCAVLNSSCPREGFKSKYRRTLQSHTTPRKPPLPRSCCDAS